MEVYVVTGRDLGWDCIVGVYSIDTDYEMLEKQFPQPDYFIFDREIEKVIPEFQD